MAAPAAAPTAVQIKPLRRRRDGSATRTSECPPALPTAGPTFCARRSIPRWPTQMRRACSPLSVSCFRFSDRPGCAVSRPIRQRTSCQRPATGRITSYRHTVPRIYFEIRMGNSGAFLGRNRFQVASVQSIAERSPSCVVYRLRSTAEVTPARLSPKFCKSTASLPCDSAEPPLPFARADLADLGAI